VERNSVDREGLGERGGELSGKKKEEELIIFEIKKG